MHRHVHARLCVHSVARDGEESEEDTDNALAKALANITKDTTAPKLREIKKSLRNY